MHIWRKTQLISSALSIFLFTAIKAQNTWNQMADFAGMARIGAVGFSINHKGYLGLGSDNADFMKDFWEYDPTANTWSQKADFGGAARDFAVGFAIGTLGYVGTGNGTGDNKDDFWQYHPASNTWTQKADFGGGKRYAATGFSIGNKGYLGTGYNDGSILKKDFYEYDPSTDTWTKKANVGGVGRWYAVSFVIGEKGYIGTARTSDPLYENDLWEYEPLTDTWTQKATMPGANRLGASAFSIGVKGYVVGGKDTQNDVTLSEMYEYNPLTDSWTQKTDLAGLTRYHAAAFAIANKGYIGTGEHSDGIYLNDFWEYTPDCETPGGLITTNIKSVSAKVNWSAVALAQKYSVRYRKTGTMPWIKTTALSNFKKLTGLTPSTQYDWSVKSVCDTANNVSSDWSASQNFTTKPLKLDGGDGTEVSLEIYPNPFAASTTVSFSLPENSRVTIGLFDLSGRKVKTLLDEYLEAGSYEIPMNDISAAGVYLIRFKNADEEIIRKMIIE